MNRLRVASSLALLATIAVFGPGCLSGEMTEEDLASMQDSLNKGKPGAANGQADYCWTGATGANLCGQGEGDCDSTAQCAAGLACVSGKGPQFGFTGDVCAPAHCGNKIKDGDETQIDCGGSCGTICPAACATPNGAADHCSASCLCAAGQGDCDSNAECLAPNVCVRSLGTQFGFTGDACAPSHCSNKIKDADETQTDCGGSCGTVCAAACSTLPANGQAGHCTVDCPCPAGGADCNANNECSTGNICVNDTGALYGFAPGIDMCEGNTCTNNAKDGTETGVDCGGSCPPCGGAYVTSARFGGTSSTHGEAVAVDGNGNIFLAGRFAGTINFGCGAMTSFGGTKSDVYVVKLSPTRTCLWSKQLGSSAGGDGDSGVAISLDTAGNPIVGSNFYASGNFVGTIKASAGNSDMFAIKLTSAAGVLSWLKTFGSTGIDRIVSVFVDKSNNTYFTGSYQNTVNFGGGGLASAGSSDIAVVKLNSLGGHVWSKRFGGTGSDIGYGITADTLSNVYAVGSFAGAVNFGTGALTASGASDGFLIKLSASTGVASLAKQFGGPSDDVVRAVEADSLGRPVIAGIFKTSIDLGGGVVSAAGTHAFIAGYTTAGGYTWGKTIGGSGVSQALSIARDSQGNSAIVGYFKGAANFGSGNVTATGADDIFIAKYTLAGALSWTAHYGGTAGDQALAGYFNGRVLWVTGDINGSASLGGPVLTGGVDSFLATYAF